MAKKALFYVRSIQVRNDLFSIFIENGFDVLEAINDDDLIFKYGLVREELTIYVHELNEEDFDNSLEALHRIDASKVRTIMLIHEYDVKTIDAAMALNVKDVVILPADRTTLKKKLVLPVIQSKDEVMPSAPKDNETEVLIQPFDSNALAWELTRAERGQYPLSLVMVNHPFKEAESMTAFMSQLEILLRATDDIQPYNNDTLLLVCPFTSKEHLVEVENKVRKAFDVQEGPPGGELFIYGVTFPTDGNDLDGLLAIMADGIHDSRLFSELEKPFGQVSREEIRDRLRRKF